MRAATNQASQGAAGAAASGGLFSGLASQSRNSLFPFLQQELNAQHTLTPQQEGEMMTSAAGGAGGADSALSGDAALRAARTRNTAGMSGLEDSIARAKEQALAKTGEGIAAKDVMLTQGNKQNAARGLQGLYGTDTSAMLRSMGLIPEDVNAEARAGQSGSLQNLTDILRAIGGAAGGAGTLLKAFK